jgi:hypothetical protein
MEKHLTILGCIIAGLAIAFIVKNPVMAYIESEKKKNRNIEISR